MRGVCAQVRIYEDEDGARKEEIAALANKDNPFAAFYDRLKETREYHRRFPNLDVTEVRWGVGKAGCMRAAGALPCRRMQRPQPPLLHLRTLLCVRMQHTHTHAAPRSLQAENDEHLLKEEPHVEFTGGALAAHSLC